jgi:hypothetical protein
VIWYLDTSAAVKLCVREAETDAMAEAITEEQPRLVSAQLLETELRRAASRAPTRWWPMTFGCSKPPSNWDCTSSARPDQPGLRQAPWR